MEENDMQDIKKEIHLHYEKKEVAGKIISSLKDQNGNVKFLKIGFGPWEKVTVEDRKC